MPRTAPLLAPAGDPSFRQPPLCLAPEISSVTATSPSDVALVTPTSLTSKQWVVPPRPKPGRKPVTDTPPTKRKAQNRAAQRAFRERRAARVGELEEQIKQMEEEDEQEQTLLRSHIEKLEKEVEQYSTDLALWVEKCRRLERELAAERQSRSPTSNVSNHSTDAVPPLSRFETRIEGNNAQATLLPEDSSIPMGCGNCTSSTSCRCIDDAFNVLNAVANGNEASPNSKRLLSPQPAHDQKRVKTESDDDLEMDFTNAFPFSQAQESSGQNALEASMSPVADPCGFCQDGTPCICAEMAATHEPDRLGGTHRLSQITPPPSEGDVSSVQQSTSAVTNPCAARPGTCTQCLADPNSTLFCKSLAASSASAKEAPKQCCGSLRGGECCQAQMPSLGTTRYVTTAGANGWSSSDSSATKQVPVIALTCAEAYTTLSRHPGYDKASSEIASWMPRLHATHASSANLAGRHAMEIDAANVMSVLRDFDRRFGENC